MPTLYLRAADILVVDANTLVTGSRHFSLVGEGGGGGRREAVGLHGVRCRRDAPIPHTYRRAGPVASLTKMLVVCTKCLELKRWWHALNVKN